MIQSEQPLDHDTQLERGLSFTRQVDGSLSQWAWFQREEASCRNVLRLRQLIEPTAE